MEATMRKFRIGKEMYKTTDHAEESIVDRKIPIEVVMGVLKIGVFIDSEKGPAIMLDLQHSKIFVCIEEDGDLVKYQAIVTVFARGRLDNGV